MSIIYNWLNKQCVEHLETTAEKAATEGNMRQLYDTINKLDGNYRKPERPVKSKEGKVITNIEEQRIRWVEHFKELLYRPAPQNPINMEAESMDLSIATGPPTVDEINMSIRLMKSGESAGQDNILTEVLETDVTVTAKIHHIIFSKIWDEEQVPTYWKERHFVKITKKGDISRCDKYNGITRLSIP
ncbi:unnamed protein product [Schistosoma margrebowiei]|uniref:Uncharacterized protein n=1 Tax=Schistosoma margrebowiei TaxID=48269 RepID=A0A183M4R4_9TREM|nr:unnamed protein product [Schistosoma margrebowiei]